MSTPNYGWTKPTLGGSTGTWGSELNTTLDDIDSQVKSNEDNIAAVADPGKNWLLNPRFDVSQEDPSTSETLIAAATTGSRYVCDNVEIFLTNAATGTVGTSRTTSVPSAFPSGFAVETRQDTLTWTVAAGDNWYISMYIEGFDYQALHGNDVALSFWVYSDVSGVKSVSFTDGSNARSYVADYTINSASTWEYKTITLTMDTAAGSWAFGETLGLNVRWGITSGSTFRTGTTNTWQAGNYIASNSLVDTTTVNDEFRIFQPKLELGSSATDFDKTALSYNETLEWAQRYYEKSYDIGTGAGTATALGCCSLILPRNRTTSAFTMFSQNYEVRKRTTPAVTVYSTLGAVNSATVAGVSRSASATEIGEYAYSGLRNDDAATWNDAELVRWHHIVDARF